MGISQFTAIELYFTVPDFNVCMAPFVFTVNELILFIKF